MLDPVLGSKGIYAKNGTVRQHLLNQGAMEFIQSVDSYYVLFQKILSILHRQPVENIEIGFQNEAKDSETVADTLIKDWLDLDKMVKRYCVQMNTEPPTSVEKAYQIHLRALEKWLDAI